MAKMVEILATKLPRLANAWGEEYQDKAQETKIPKLTHTWRYQEMRSVHHSHSLFWRSPMHSTQTFCNI
jgi:hypothetical protein